MTTADIEREKALKARRQSEEGLSTQRPRRVLGEEIGNGPVTEKQADVLQAENDAKRYAKPQVSQTQTAQNFNSVEGLYGDLNQRVNDTIKNTFNLGQSGSEAMQNVKVPRNKMYTIRDIMKDPELEGMRDYLLADRIGTMWQNIGSNASGEEGKYTSKLEDFNDTMNKAYAQNKANVDTSATQANLDAVNAGLAQQVALETNLSDTVANVYIERFKSLQNAESKRLLLEKMADDSKMWANLDDDQKINLAGYMGILSGNYSLTELLVQKYAPRMLNMLDAVMDKLTDGKWSDWKKDEEDKKKIEYPKILDSLPRNENGYITTYEGEQVDPKDIAENTDNYKVVNLGNGESIVIKKGGTRGYKEEGELAQLLAKSVNLDEEQMEEIFKFAIDVPFTFEDPSRIKEVVRKIKNAQNEQLRLEAELQEKRDKFTKTVQDVRDSNDAPLKKLEKLEKLNTDDIIDEVSLNLYKEQLGANGTAVANSMVKDYEDKEDATYKEKYDNLNSVLKTYGKYLDDYDKGKLQDKINKYETLYTKIDPYEKKANDLIKKNTVNGNIWWTLNNKGEYELRDTSSASGYQMKINPSSYDFANGKSYGDKFANSLLEVTSLESLCSMFPNTTPKAAQEYVKDTKEYNSMARLLNNKTFQANCPKSYSELSTRFNNIMNGTLGEE